MKNNIIKVMLIGTTATLLGMGCAFSEKLPSVTIGGAANKNAVLDAEIGKAGVSITAPLVNVDVPFPTVDVKDGKKK